MTENSKSTCTMCILSRTSLYVLLSVVLSLIQFSLQKNVKISQLLQDATKTWHDVRPATYGNRDVDWRRFYSRGLLGTSTTLCVPFSFLELAINKQRQLLTFHVQVGYVKRPSEKTGTS